MSTLRTASPRRLCPVWSSVALLAFALAWCGFGLRDAAAHGTHGRTTKLELGPKREATPPAGPRGRAQLESTRIRLLRDDEARYVAELRVKNVGQGPLRVHRVGLAASEAWPESPPGLGVQALERDAPIPPGGSRSYQLSWRAESARAEQLQATVEVDSDSAAPDALYYDAPVRASVWADRRVGPARYLLSLLVLLPLLLPLSALVAARLPALGERLLRRAAVAVTGAHAAAALWAFVRFDRGFGRADGNEGLQMIERASLGGGLEWFLALDGVSAPIVAALALTAFASLAALGPSARGHGVAIASAGLLLSSSSLFLVAQSPALLVASLGVAAAASVAMVGAASTSTRAARHLAPAALLSLIAVAIVGHLLAHHAPSEQGALAATLPEIVRHGLHLHEGDASWLGLPTPRAAWAFAAVAALPLLGLLPFHGWSSALVRDTAPGVAALAMASLGAIGGALLLRIALVLLPGESAWGTPALLALSLGTALLLGLAALGEPDPKRLVGRLSALSGALVVVALCSRTAQGLQAAVLLITARTLALPLLVLTAEAFARRLGALERHTGGVAATAPKLAALWVLALLAASGLPGGASFWGVWLGLSGVVARTPAAGFVAIAAVAVVALAHLGGFGRASRQADPAWRTSERLASHAGKVPELFPRELVWAVPLAVALLALAVLPRSVGSTTDTLVIDALPAIDPPGPTQIG